MDRSRRLRREGRRRRTRVRSLVGVLGFALALWILVGGGPAGASPAEHYSGTHFGADNLPPGCSRDMSLDNPNNI